MRSAWPNMVKLIQGMFAAKDNTRLFILLIEHGDDQNQDWGDATFAHSLERDNSQLVRSA